MSNKNVKNVCVFTEPRSSPCRLFFLNHGTRFSFVPENEDQWFCFCQENNFEPPKAEWLLYVLPKILLSAHTLYVCVCFVLFSQQTAIISLYSINWLVFITETECVFYAVRTEYIQYGLIFYTTRFNIQNSTFCPHCIYVFCMDLRTNNDYFTIQHSLTGFYIRHWVCLLCGTLRIFI